MPLLDTAAIAQRHARLRDETDERFAMAALCLPDDNSDLGDKIWMLPLIVQQSRPSVADEVEPDATTQTETRMIRQAASSFGGLRQGDSGAWQVDADSPTLYTLTRQQKDAGPDCHLQFCLWFYPAAEPALSPEWRGVCAMMTANQEAMAWEAVQSDSADRVYYVSQTLETAAVSRVAQPCADRRFAIEPELRESPELFVARIIREGAQPMGPMIYVDHSQHHIVTMRCRCEDSLVDNYTRNTHYRVELLEDESQLPGVSQWPRLAEWLREPVHFRRLRILPP